VDLLALVDPAQDVHDAPHEHVIVPARHQIIDVEERCPKRLPVAAVLRDLPPPLLIACLASTGGFLLQLTQLIASNNINGFEQHDSCLEEHVMCYVQ
jgi:hypothetical protein